MCMLYLTDNWCPGRIFRRTYGFLWSWAMSSTNWNWHLFPETNYCRWNAWGSRGCENLCSVWQWWHKICYSKSTTSSRSKMRKMHPKMDLSYEVSKTAKILIWAIKFKPWIYAAIPFGGILKEVSKMIIHFWRHKFLTISCFYLFRMEPLLRSRSCSDI